MLFSVLGLWFLAIVGLFIIVPMIKRDRYNAPVIIGVYIVALILLRILLLSEFPSRSRVDTEPLQRLADVSYIDFDDLGRILEAIESSDEFTSVRGNRHAIHPIYSFSWRSDLKPWEPGGAGVEIHYFETVESAVTRFRSKYRDKYRNVRISEHVAADLYHSRMYRSADTFYAASWKKDGYTSIIIGNVIVNVREQGSFFRIGRSSSGFIEVFTDIVITVMELD